MAYKQAKVPTFENLQQVGQFFQNELAKIADAFTETRELELRESFREPDKPRAGMIVFADGTHWDPADGRGPYYYDGVWKLISAGVPSGYTDENARDAIAGAFALGTQTGITFTHNDPGDAFSLAVTIPEYTDADAQAVVDAALAAFWFLHSQPIAATTWTINHNLGRPVSVTVYDVGSNELLVEVIHTSTNQVQVIFNTATAGFAYCI